MSRPEAHATGLSIHRRARTGPPSPPVPPVVLVHGAMDRATAFASTARHLRDLDIVRYDRRGYGRSLGAGVACTLDELVDDLLAVIDGTVSCVAGHSIGGTIALAAGARCPELVVSVGAFEPPVPWEPWWPRRSPDTTPGEQNPSPDAAAESFMRRMIGDRRWDELPERTREQRRREGPALLADFASLQVDTPPFDAANLEPPVTLGYGSQTDAWHVRAVEELHRSLGGSEVTIIEGAPHGAHYTHPARFAAFVRGVVERAPLTP